MSFVAERPSEPASLRAGLVWAPAVLLALGGALLACAVRLAPGDSARVVAVFPPWWSQAEAIGAAAEVGAVAGVSKSGFAVGLISPHPGVAAALRAHGALFVADGRAFPSCFTSSLKGPTR
jgi:hypothetical protein